MGSIFIHSLKERIKYNTVIFTIFTTIKKGVKKQCLHQNSQKKHATA